MRIARKGFTLVEILIVVVILGILAAIVVPQFTSASQAAVKGALQTQLQTIESQVELYRVNESGRLPHEDADDPLADDGTNDGWGIMVSEDFLKEEPYNGYTTSEIVTTEADDDAALTASLIDAADAEGSDGWVYSEATGRVFALGYNEDTNALANEDEYEEEEEE